MNPSLAWTLADQANLAIRNARQDDEIIIGTSEPNQVARLVTSLPKRLVEAWQPFVRAGALTVSAAFCHAKPQVQWESPFNPKESFGPELADLLIIFDVRDAQGKRAQRSLLSQVKVCSNAVCSLSSAGDLAQRYMYSEWPEFSLPAQPASLIMPMSPVDVNPGRNGLSSDLQARYACVEGDKTANTSWWLEGVSASIGVPNSAASFKDVPTVNISLTKSLGEGLVDMYAGCIGRLCDNGDSWSQLTDYLQRYVACHTVNSKLPHVSARVGVSPLPLVAASTFVVDKKAFFPRISEVQHFVAGFTPRVDWSGFSQFNGRGYFYGWPGFVAPVDGQFLDFDFGAGMGVIRVSIDEPLFDGERAAEELS